MGECSVDRKINLLKILWSLQAIVDERGVVSDTSKMDRTDIQGFLRGELVVNIDKRW